MLNLAKSKIHRSVERATAGIISAEGCTLVAGTQADGTFGVQPGSATANEQFVGVALSQQLDLDYLPMVEELAVATVTSSAASKTIVGGSLKVVVASSGLVLVDGNPGTTTGQYSETGGVITVHTDQTDETLLVTYRYAPTVIEAKAIQGDVLPGGAAGAVLGSVGVIEIGDVYTSSFDTSVDWSTVAVDVPVTLGAGGVFTIGGTGSPIANAVVINIPSVDEPFLGLRLG